MKVFRTDDDARKAGAAPTGISYSYFWGMRSDGGEAIRLAHVLTPCESDLLTALEALIAGVKDKLTGVSETVDGYSEACDLIKSLGVEG